MGDDDRDLIVSRVVPRCPHCGERLHRAGADEHPLWECPEDGFIVAAE